MKNEVRGYFDAVPAARRAHVETLHGLVLKCFPDAEVTMRYKMPTYSAGAGWVAIASQKHYVSLYTCGAPHLADFKVSHPHIKTGKGCMNFRERDEIPEEAVMGVIRHAMRQRKNAGS